MDLIALPLQKGQTKCIRGFFIHCNNSASVYCIYHTVEFLQETKNMLHYKGSFNTLEELLFSPPFELWLKAVSSSDKLIV